MFFVYNKLCNLQMFFFPIFNNIKYAEAAIYSCSIASRSENIYKISIKILTIETILQKVKMQV